MTRLRLELRVLGGLELTVGDSLVPLGGYRPQALTALLLVQRGRPLSLDAIVDRLWPDESPSTATKTVQVYVSRLRAALGPGRDRLRSAGGGYELTFERHEVDAWLFESEIDLARRVSAGDPQTLSKIERALSRWRGRPFGQLADEPFLRHEVQRLEDLEAEARELRARALLAAGRATDALGELRALTAAHPGRESAWCQLILALYLAGRQAEALAAFHEARRYLDEELGIEPGPDLQGAHLAVLQQAVPASAISRAQDPMPLMTTPDLIGREGDALAVEALFLGGARLVTLIGPGGIGKTSLASAVLAHLRPGISGPVALVELDSVRAADGVPGAVAAALGSDAEPAVQLADADSLLVLDNLEHVVESAPWINQLLNSSRGLRILATSREPLRITHEVAYVVSPLSQDAARELFLARARQVRPDLDLSPAIDAICARVDRLPLAIELAAARVNLLSPPALLARLDRALEVLGTNRRDRPDRQRTVRSTIAWSYDLLEPDAQRAFARLAVFAGGFRLEAAESIAGMSVDTLEQLLRQSLVSSRYVATDPRFALLETIRAFALERLAEAGDEDSVRAAHASWAVEFANRFHRGKSRLDATDVEVLASELENFRAAMEWAGTVGADDVRLQIAVALSDVWQTRGLFAEARRWLELPLELPNEDSKVQPLLLVEAVHEASTMAFRQGNYEDTERLANEVLSLADGLGRPFLSVAALAKLAQMALRAGDVERARTLHQKAIAIAESDRDERSLLVSLSSQANADLLAGRADLAVGAFERCLKIALELGRPESIATSYFNLGLALVVDGGHEKQAADALADALDRYTSLEDVDGIAYVLLAAAYGTAQHWPRAAATALGASTAALASIGAELEAAEQRLHTDTIETLRVALAPGDLASAMSQGADLPASEWGTAAAEALSNLSASAEQTIAGARAESRGRPPGVARSRGGSGP